MADIKENIDMTSKAYSGFDWGKLDILAQFPCERNVAAARMGCSTAWISQCVKAKYGMTWKQYNKMRTREHLLPLAQKSIELNLRKGNADITKFVIKNNTEYEENPTVKEIDTSKQREAIEFVEDKEERDNPLEGSSELPEE